MSPVEQVARSSLSPPLTLISSTESSPSPGSGDRGPDWGKSVSGAGMSVRRGTPAGECPEVSGILSCVFLLALVLCLLGPSFSWNRPLQRPGCGKFIFKRKGLFKKIYLSETTAVPAMKNKERPFLFCFFFFSLESRKNKRKGTPKERAHQEKRKEIFEN